MPALNLASAHYALVKRSSNNWPSKNRGVMVVFCIIGTLALLVIALVLHRKMVASRQRREKEEFQQGAK